MVLKNPTEYEKGKTIVYFVRHGDRLHIPNKKDIGLKYPGPGLSKLGKKQAKNLAKEFLKKKREIDILYCSGMTRAIETAQEIGKIIKKKPKICKELSEFNAILWYGKIYHKKFWKHYKKYIEAKRAFNKILEKNKGKVVVIVAHGNIIRGLFGHKFGLSFKKRGAFDSNNCHISKLRFKGKNLNWIYYLNSTGVI